MKLVLLLLVGVLCSAQTRIRQEQIRNRVNVLEWSGCFTPDTPKVSCVGLVLLKLTKPDGEVAFYYVGIPADPKTVSHTGWVQTNIVAPATQTGLTPNQIK